MHNKIKLFSVGVALFFLANCGVEGVAPTTSTTTTSTSSVTFNVNNTAASESLPPPGSGKAADISVAKAAVVTTGSVSCISRDSNGNKTVKTGSLDSSGNAVVSGIPNTQDNVCYLLNASGSVLTTIRVTDSNAVGGARDGFVAPANGTLNVSYNGTTGANNTGSTSCPAPSSGGSGAIDLSGTWKMTCNGVKFVKDDSTDSSQTCSSDLNNQNVFLHRVLRNRRGWGSTLWLWGLAFSSCFYKMWFYRRTNQYTEWLVCHNEWTDK